MANFETNKIMKGNPVPKNYQVELSNWRKYPYNSWSFVNVRNLIPTAQIPVKPNSKPNFISKFKYFDDLEINHKEKKFLLKDIFNKCNTDAFLVMHKGKLLFEYFDNFTKKSTPHIIFSISKSLTSLLFGIIQKKYKINLNSQVCHYIPELTNTAYRNATIRNVLDMNVSSDFIEDYSGEAEIFKKYRASTGWDVIEEGVDNVPHGLYEFLSSMPSSSKKLPHGTKYHYCSPHSDLLGWIIERICGDKYYNILSKLLFLPAGLKDDANVTLDKWGASRSAGGISISPYDLLILSELVRCYGSNGKNQIIPESWIDDFINFKDNKCYLNQDKLERFPNGNYRSKWYQTGFQDNEFCAIGIHGQNIWINPKKELTIIRMSSASDPINIKTEELMFSVFKEISNSL